MELLLEEAVGRKELAPGAVLLTGFARAYMDGVMAGLQGVTDKAPFRHMVTPGGHRMSVAMTSCGLGWVSDAKGYRYEPQDPVTGEPWPAIPEDFLRLAKTAAAEAGYVGFEPDACLINRYEVGAKLSLHQDKDEKDMGAPIVSVSLGLPAVFQFGGLQRSDPIEKIRLAHGDVVVWGGPSRLAYHGILPLKDGEHDLLGSYRVNLTFRKVR